MLETAISAGTLGNLKAAKSLTEAARTALYLGTVQATTQAVEMPTGIRTKFDARAIALQISATLANWQIRSSLSNVFDADPSEVLLNNISRNTVSSILGTAITKTPFNIENLAAQSIGDAISDTLAGGFSNGLDRMNHLKPIEEGTSDFIMEAEKVAKMPIPDTRLDFSEITGKNIREAGPSPKSWHEESKKHSMEQNKQKMTSLGKPTSNNQAFQSEKNSFTMVWLGKGWS